MTCETKTTEIVLEAASVSFGKEEQTCIDPVAGLAGGESLHVSNVSTDFYLWFTVDGVGVDPAPVGRTAIPVALPAAYTVAQATELIKTAVESVKGFYGTVTIDGLGVVLEAPTMGVSLTAAADVDSGFTIAVKRAGFLENLGKTKEGITVSFEATTFDVKSNQTGELLLDQIIQGTSASMEMSLLEVSKDRLEKIIAEGYGDSYTPAAGTSLVGFGTSKNFKSSFESAGRLVLHPLRLEDSVRTEDVTFWKTLPMPSSINYDGGDTKALSVSFSALVDETKPKEISVYAVGDSEQFLA